MRSDEFGRAPVGGAFDVDAVGIKEFDFHVEIGEFSGVDGAVFENPVVDEGATLSNGSDDGEEGEIVDIEAWERHGVDFVDGSDEVGFFDIEVDETGAVVGGEILGGFIDVGMHAFQDFEFDFEEFDGGAHDSDLGISNKGGGDEAHSFDGVFGDIVFDILVDERATLNDETGGADSRNLNAELFEEETGVLHHVVR